MKAAMRDMKVSEWKLGSCSTAPARSVGTVSEVKKWVRCTGGAACGHSGNARDT